MRTDLILEFLSKQRLENQYNNYENIILIEHFCDLRNISLPNFELSKREYLVLVSKKIKLNLKSFFEQHGKEMKKIVINTITRVITRRTLNYVLDKIFKKEKQKKRVQKGGSENIKVYKPEIDKLIQENIKFIKKTRKIIKK